jgi:hypothetical protein
MFTRIDFVKDIARILRYHEKKLRLGQAECLEAFNFLKDLDQLSFQDKIWHFQRLNSLNRRALVTTFHASINFHPSDNLDNHTLIGISKKFMQKIGFGKQPFLIYRHYDAGHPHVHLVSTKVMVDGTIVGMGTNRIYKLIMARLEIELEYNLVKHEAKGQSDYAGLTQANAQKLKYGKSETKMGLENVLSAVIHQYRFGSLGELNAVLKLYNVMADRGLEGSRLYQWRGLLYRILDDRGKPIGLPIKASEISFKPTLNYLEKKFIQNQSLRMEYERRLKTKIDWVLSKRDQSFADLICALSKEGINAVIIQKNELLVEPIFFVDHQTKTVFSGTDLDPRFSAAAIQQRCIAGEALLQAQGSRLTPTIMLEDAVYTERESFKPGVNENGRIATLIQNAGKLGAPIQADDGSATSLKLQKRDSKRQSQFQSPS